MTIHELVEKEQYIKNILEQAESVMPKLNAAVGVIASGEAPLSKEAVEDLCQARYATSICLTEARKLLFDYAGLLSTIMRSTEVSWPPSCCTRDVEG